VKKILEKISLLLALGIIIVAIIFSLFRALTPWAKQYKPDVEQHLSLLIGQPVKIQTMETSWYWFQPVLKLNDIEVTSLKEGNVHLGKLLIGIDLVKSLWHWQLQPGLFYLNNLELKINQTDNGWEVDGLHFDQHVNLNDSVFDVFITWLAGQNKIIVRDLNAVIKFKDSKLLALQNIYITAKKRGSRLIVKGGFKFKDEPATSVFLLAEIALSSTQKPTGTAFLALKNIRLDRWKPYFSSIHPFEIQDGNMNADFWIDLSLGKVSNIQSKFDGENIHWRYNNTPIHVINTIAANWAWRPIPQGWSTSVDQLELTLDGITWPKNTLQVNYSAASESYRIFVQKILIFSALKLNLPLPPTLKKIAQYDLQGTLINNEIEVQRQSLIYVQTQFRDLSWKPSASIPGFNHLSGAVYWQKKEGRIEIEAKNPYVNFLDLPAVTFKEISAAIDWKELSHGVKATLEHLVINHPELLVNAKGALDGWDVDGYLRVGASFSAKNAHQWMKYLPARYLKPKLDRWLKKEIKKVGQLNGELAVQGKLADFPFDHTPGEFLIKTYLSDVDLVFKKGWPLTKDIEAYLQVDKRILEARVIHAMASNIPVNAAHLIITSLGIRENLFFHAKVQAAGDNAINYVLHSPLKQKLNRLKLVKLQGPVNLDLRLEVPLYPENDKILAQGIIHFEDNALTLHHPIADFLLENIRGSLLFDQDGLTNSVLEAVLMGDPVALHLRSVRGSQSYTEISIIGDTTIEMIKNKLKLPMLQYLKGHLSLQSIFTVTADPNDLDQVRIISNLQGTAINLPSPFGKKFNESTPLRVDIGFNPQRAIHISFNYNDKVNSVFLLNKKEEGFSLDSGIVYFGKEEVSLPKEPGIAIAGQLANFDWENWKKLSTSVSPAPSNTVKYFDLINRINLTIGNLKINQQVFNNLSVRGYKNKEANWHLGVNHQNLEGNFVYDRQANHLNGAVKFLTIDQKFFSTSSKEISTSTILPSQIPNLTLNVEKLTVGKSNLGALNLTSTSIVDSWKLNQAKLTSPAYSIEITGDWTKNAKQDYSSFELKSKLFDLKQALQAWNIVPAVEADDGRFYFKGGWDGPFYHFGLAKLSGDFYVELQDGRITHLSPETEKKLGMGKLLSVLSLQTIPRRLMLDFSDLSSDGYSFDEFKANFKVKNGVMHTDDGYIDGPVAYAKMQGNLDLPRRLYDMQLQVNPHITASLPIVATIAGGPIAGIATWVASKIITPSVQMIGGYTYQITGPWTAPSVQQVSIIKKDN
jgi:uncharacterized protein (TIGR02099 family)